MQKLKAGDIEIEVESAWASPIEHDGIIVDSIKLSLPGDITEEEIVALVENPWNMCMADGTHIKTYSGYNVIKEYSITFMKVPEGAKMLVELTNAAAEITEARLQADAAAAEAEAAKQQAATAKQEAEDVKSQMQFLLDALQSSGINSDAVIQSRLSSLL